MILPVRERRDFQHLASHGTRIRTPALWCNCCPIPEHSPPLPKARVAFALPRRLGTAVRRNQLRRRLRELLREFERTQGMPSALMVIGARPRAIELTFDQLRAEMRTLLHRIQDECSE